jgi:hypothetical protein
VAKLQQRAARLLQFTDEHVEKERQQEARLGEVRATAEASRARAAADRARQVQTTREVAYGHFWRAMFWLIAAIVFAYGFRSSPLDAPYRGLVLAAAFASPVFAIPSWILGRRWLALSKDL